MAELVNLPEAEALLKSFPPNCGGCSSVELPVLRLLSSISSGQMTPEDAEKEAVNIGAEVGKMCVLGQTTQDGDPPVTRCNYGIRA